MSPRGFLIGERKGFIGNSTLETTIVYLVSKARKMLKSKSCAQRGTSCGGPRHHASRSNNCKATIRPPIKQHDGEDRRPTISVINENQRYRQDANVSLLYLFPSQLVVIDMSPNRFSGHDSQIALFGVLQTLRKK